MKFWKTEFCRWSRFKYSYSVLQKCDFWSSEIYLTTVYGRKMYFIFLLWWSLLLTYSLVSQAMFTFCDYSQPFFPPYLRSSRYWLIKKQLQVLSLLISFLSVHRVVWMRYLPELTIIYLQFARIVGFWYI